MNFMPLRERKKRGRSSAEKQGRYGHAFKPVDVLYKVPFTYEGVDEFVNNRVLAAFRIKIAVAAFFFAEGDVNIERKRTITVHYLFHNQAGLV